MNLGIAVVYMILPGDEDLIDLHLRYIEQCTRVPFTIYAAANRLSTRARNRLTAKAYVRVCSIPETDLRSSGENAYYLERLIAAAIEDGATHVATLHVDSFPVRDGWASDLAAALSDSYAFAAIVRNESCDPKPMTAGLFFPRDFYLRYRPRLLMTEKEISSDAGRDYVRCLSNPTESGGGYGFLAFEKGLRWFPLLRTNANQDHYYFGAIHGDLVFHLGSAASESRSFPGSREHLWIRPSRRQASNLLPQWTKKILKILVPHRIIFPEHAIHQRAHAFVKKSLLTDPDGYLRYLRTGNR